MTTLNLSIQLEKTVILRTLEYAKLYALDSQGFKLPNKKESEELIKSNLIDLPIMWWCEDGSVCIREGGEKEIDKTQYFLKGYGGHATFIDEPPINQAFVLLVQEKTKPVQNSVVKHYSDIDSFIEYARNKYEESGLEFNETVLRPGISLFLDWLMED